MFIFMLNVLVVKLGNVIGFKLIHANYGGISI